MVSTSTWPPRSEVVVRLLEAEVAEDVEVFRTLRLRALWADPSAFASTWTDESDLEDAHWRQRLQSGPTGQPVRFWVAESGGVGLGLVGLVFTEHDPARMVVSMWVDRRVRRLGIARRLIDAALAWADEQGDDEVVLWVRHDNQSAIALYREVGFEATGHVEASPIHACVDELEMRRIHPAAIR